MAIIGEGISHRGLVVESFYFPFYVTGTVTQDDIGKAVSLDATAAKSVKLAADGDAIIGELVSYEDRVVEGVQVGTVALKGGMRFTASGVVAVGNSVIGAGAGVVKAAVAADHSNNIVTAVDGTLVEVLIV